MRTGARSIALGALAALALVASASPAGAWTRRATAPEHQSLDDVIGLPGGAILAAGTESSGINRALLIELGASGVLAWARKHGSPAGTAGERAHAVTALPDGDLVVAGRSVVLAQGAWRPFGWVARLSPDAVDVRWSTRLSEPAGQGVFHDLVATADGGVVAAGQASEGGSVLPWLVKLAPDGAPQWEARFEPATGAMAFGVAALADGGVVACGPGLSAFSPSWIARLAADGTLLWQREIGVVLRALAPDPAAPDGTVVAAGWTRDYQAWAGRFEPDGTVSWQRGSSWPTPPVRSHFASGVLATDDGSVVLVGSSALSGPSASELFVASFGPDGELAWSTAWAPGAHVWGGRIARTTDGAFAAVGRLEAGENDDDLLVWRVGANGGTGEPCEGLRSPAFDAAPYPEEASPATPSVTLDAPASVPLDLSVAASALELEDDCCGVAGPPSELSPPGAAVPLRVSSAELRWEEPAARGACAANLYRGVLEELWAGTHGACLQRHLFASAAQDPDEPPSGSGWFYLVAGVSTQGEGPLGRSSLGELRAAARPCP